MGNEETLRNIRDELVRVRIDREIEQDRKNESNPWYRDQATKDDMRAAEAEKKFEITYGPLEKFLTAVGGIFVAFTLAAYFGPEATKPPNKDNGRLERKLEQGVEGDVKTENVLQQDNKYQRNYSTPVTEQEKNLVSRVFNLREPDWRRAEAVRELSNYQEDRVAKILAEKVLFQDNSYDVRKETAKTLGFIGNEHFIPYLERTMNNPNEHNYIRVQAQISIQRIRERTRYLEGATSPISD